jgi:molecular chaperone DnaK
MEPIIGIDLGTTNSEVAFIFDKNVNVIMDADDGIVPSCVGLDADGKIIVGATAKNQAVAAPDRTVLSIKRKMGSNEKVSLGTETYLPQEISAFILRALKERAEKRIGQNIGKAVITVPAYFTDAQRQATREAGQLAGLTVMRIINEPTAAALAYEQAAPQTRQVLIYDLGGGTFDVSIVKIEDGVVEVLSSTGDNRLGGDDFDDKIVDVLKKHIEKKHQVLIDGNRAAIARLKRAAETAKIALSNAPYAVIEEDHIAKKDGEPVHLSYELSRHDFEQMIEADVQRTMTAVSKALDDARLLPSAIDKIILVGGSTRIPMISRMLEEKTGLLPHSEIDPDLCVVLGAAMQAGREMGMDASGVLVDITPYTFGTSAIGELDGIETPHLFVPLIRRNTKLPARKSDAFYTLYDNQEMVEVQVYQGEEPHALDNVRIGSYQFDLSPALRGSVIILDFDLDVNGILHLQAIEKVTGRKIEAVIENAISRFSEEELIGNKARLDAAWNSASSSDPMRMEEKQGHDLPYGLSEIISRAKTKLEEASADDRDEMINLMEDIEDAAGSGDEEKALSLARDLEDILFYME